MSSTTQVGTAIIEALVAEGVEHVFGMPGGHVLALYEGLYGRDDISHVLVRHEFAAAAMASAHAQLTGEPGVCVVTAGPGATNLLSAVAEAFVGCLPMVIFAGRATTRNAHKGASQEVDTHKIFAPVTKWAARIDNPDTVLEVVSRAFSIARHGRPGPVYIDIPRDVLDARLASSRYQPAARRQRPNGDSEAVRIAGDALAQAKLPVIVAGGGLVASRGFEALREIAEHLDAPVMTSLAARGALPDSHRLAIGGTGAHRNRYSGELLREADVVLLVGARLEEMETNWTEASLPSSAATVIQIDISGEAIGQSIPVHVPIVGDAAAILGQLRQAVGPEVVRTQLRDRLEAARQQLRYEVEALAKREQKPLHPLSVIRAAQEVFPAGSTVAFDVGCLAQHIAGAFPYFEVLEPGTVVVPSSFYGMGFATAALPAAKISRPDSAALGFTGDGSFQMVSTILPVAAEHKLGATWVVLNDSALGSIRDIQEFGKEGRVLGTEFAYQPDLSALARANGCVGIRVEKQSDIEQSLRVAYAANQAGIPAVLDCIVAPERMHGTLEHYSSFFPEDMIVPQRSAPDAVEAWIRPAASYGGASTPSAMSGTGQPHGAVIQYAYVVPDLEKAMEEYSQTTGAGPWFVRGPFSPENARYRGEPLSGTFVLARAYSGSTMIELIQQLDDSVSIFHEKAGARTYGFHHWAIVSPNFDQEIANRMEAGYVEAFFDVLPTGSRVVYLDSPYEGQGKLEVIELTSEQDAAMTEMHRAHLIQRAFVQIPSDVPTSK